jgi:type II secretion system protein G
MKTKTGFTLIELMVVMAILAILLAIGAGAFTSSMKKGRDSTRKGNLRAITNALELYFNDNGRYPGDDGSGGMKGCLGGVGLSPTPAPSTCTVNGAFQDANSTLYMAQLPTDPVSSQRYYYRAPSSSQFQIYARLENAQDPAIITPTPALPSCGSGSCNWGLSSANTNP